MIVSVSPGHVRSLDEGATERAVAFSQVNRQKVQSREGNRIREGEQTGSAAQNVAAAEKT